MIITLKSLELKNFKGIKKISIDFDNITNISGENGSGKTTIFDAFNWLLFDKDSKGRQVGKRESEFQIKTFNTEGETIPYLEHEVTGVLNADGKEIILSKLYKENWVKKKGNSERTFDGHETIYSINEIPVKKVEYNSKVNELLAENTFKLISNPLYFNTLNWKERREILMDIIGDIDSDRVIDYNKSLSKLSGELDEGIDAFISGIKARIKKLKDKVKSIPYRIDELNNSIVEENFEQLEIDKRVIESEIKKVDDMLQDGNKANDELFKLKTNLYDLQKELRNKQDEAKEELLKPIRSIKNKINNIEADIYDREVNISKTERNIKTEKYNEKILNETRQDLRDMFSRKKKEEFQFDETLGHCDKCLRPYEEDNIESIKEKYSIEFEERKKIDLDSIRTRGHRNNAKIEITNKKIEDLNKELEVEHELLEVDRNKLEEFKRELDNLSIEGEDIVLTGKFEDKDELMLRINNLEEEISDYQGIGNNNSHLKAKKYELETRLKEVLKLLYKKETNLENQSRINELQEEEQKISEQIAALEGKEFLAQEFIKTKVELLEDSINKKFENVTFKLFDIQINGGLTETCEALVKGVPFSNANDASKVNAGLDIINTLCNHYNVTAPIFIDNRESTNKIIDTKSQVINLSVSKDKKLKVKIENREEI